MSEQQLREDLVAAFKNRAILYWLIFDELRRDVGQERAVSILKRAIYRRGQQTGQKYSQFAPNDFAGLKDAFVGGIPDEGRLFDPQVVRCDAEGLDIHLEACPLKEAWEELGLDDRDKAIICEIAGAIDKGKFEAAGFSFEPNTWQPGRSGCCHLEIRPAGGGR
jgi:L-2-amino-thiazoline-4-carboxylic acid hydrolase